MKNGWRNRTKPPFFMQRSFIALDTETALFSDDCAAPPIVVVSIFDGARGYLWHRSEALPKLTALFDLCLSNRFTLVAHHAPYDFCGIVNEWPSLIDRVFDLYDAGLIEDTLINDKLDDIARGVYENKGKGRWHSVNGSRKMLYYGLKDCVMRRLGAELVKDETRQNYAQFMNTPIEAMPEAFRRYALLDAEACHRVRVAQETAERDEPARPGCYVYQDAPAQARAGFALHLCRVWGIRTEPSRTERVRLRLKQRLAESEDALIAAKLVRPGYFRPRAKTWVKPSKDMKAIRKLILENIGLEEPKRTPTGEVAIDAEQLERVDHPIIANLIRFNKAQKTLGYVDVLGAGFTHAIHSEPNTLVENGRISWGSDSPDGAESPKSINLTNLPREPGVRECFVPRAGWVFFSIDYSQLELRTLAQVCLWMFGRSTMAELINAGADLHNRLAAQFLSMSLEEFERRLKDEDDEIARVRDAAKRANFGFPGGMGIDRFQETNRDLKLDRETVVRLKEAWFASYPEMREYFNVCSMIENTSGQVEQLTSGRVRGGVGFCDLANTFFSGLAADGAKDALYRITRAMYKDRASPAYGGRLNAFVHDEFFGEFREAQAHDGVIACERIAQETMQARLPGVKVETSKAIMRAWRKGAKAYFIDGVLRPYEESPKFKEKLAKGEVEP